jgi:hypothetical protein
LVVGSQRLSRGTITIVVIAVAGPIGGFLLGALHDLSLEWLFPIGSSSRELLLHYVPFALVAIVAAFLGFHFGIARGRKEGRDEQPNSQLVDENARLTRQQQNSATEIDRLTAQMRELAAEREVLETKITELTKERQGLLNDIADLGNKIRRFDLEKMRSMVLGHVGSDHMSRHDIVKYFVQQGANHDDVVAAIGELIRSGDLALAGIRGDLGVVSKRGST